MNSEYLLYAMTALLPILGMLAWALDRRRKRDAHISTTEWCARLRALDAGRKVKRPRARHKDCKTGAPGVSTPEGQPAEEKVAMITRRKSGGRQ